VSAASTGEAARTLRGQAAVASAKRAYVIFATLFGSERFRALAEAGARPQRLLWASTGTKDPTYPASKYVEPLVGDGTITTLPRETLDAYRREGQPRPTLADGAQDAERTLRALGALGIDMDAVTERLEVEGVEKFVTPFESLLRTIERALARTASRA
jgi:transaldolase